MKYFTTSLALVLSLLSTLALAEGFPQNPDPQQTPGTLCRNPDGHRYKERIPYCQREVNKRAKAVIIEIYEEKLGYEILKYGRQKFKIDHLIPLCAGGSNDQTNLWPQHESIYAVTDPIEQEICIKMSEDRLNQQRAIEYIKRAKLHLDEAPAILKEVQAL